jgi:hypothetical protein
MHSFLIAACFVLIVLAPCVAAQSEWALSLQSQRKPKLKPTVNPKQQRRQEERRRLAEQIALEELQDPSSYADMRRRAVLLKCVRVSQVKQIHLAADGAMTASGKSRAA